jgi:MFS family permease
MPPAVSARLRALLPAPGPSRALAYATLVGSTSRGLFITASVVFFHSSVGLSAVEVGTGMTIAAVAGLFAGVPMGHLADKLGPRNVTVGFGLAGSVAMLGYFLVTSWTGFVLVASLAAFLQAAGQAARGALIAGSVPPEQRVRTRAYLRAVTNAGWTIGAPVAGLALYHDTQFGYLALIGFSAALTSCSALLTLRVPTPIPVARPAGAATVAAFRDRPFLALTALNAVLTIHYGIINVAIPLWVVSRTEAPAWFVAVMAALNTAMVVFLQVRTSRGSGTISGAARAQRRAGILLLIACALYGIAAGQPAWVAMTALAAGALVHVVGELFQAAGGWGLSFELAPPHAQGQYQGLYNTGFQFADIVAPALLSATVIGWGLPGWLLFGGLFAVTGLAVPVVTRWAVRTRTWTTPEQALPAARAA